MMRLTSQEITFLRWLRTNGGRGVLRAQDGFSHPERIIRAGYADAGPTADQTSYTLTDLGREVLALEGF
jgi:hypothetical protein